MSDMVKYRAAIWAFLKPTALYLTMSDIVHCLKYFLELLSGNSATNIAIADGEGGQLATFSRISIGSRR